MAENKGGSYSIQKNGTLKLLERTEENNVVLNQAADYTQENIEPEPEVKDDA